MSISERYIVDNKTLYIEPKMEGFNSTHSVIMEKSSTFRLYIPSKPLDIIRESCRYYGKEFKYQKEMSKAIVGNKYMLPICINDQNAVIFIPTGKYDAEDTYWIAYQHVSFSRDLGNGLTSIHFNNGSEIRVPLSCNVWESKRNIGEQLFVSIKRE